MYYEILKIILQEIPILYCRTNATEIVVESLRFIAIFYEIWYIIGLVEYDGYNLYLI